MRIPGYLAGTAVLFAVLAAQAQTPSPDRVAYDAAFQDSLKNPSDPATVLRYAEAAVKVNDLEGAISALERLLLDPVQVVIMGSGPWADRLEATAVARFAINKTVMRIAPHQLVPGGLPEALAETLVKAPPPVEAKAWAIVCMGRTCLPPILDAEVLLEALEESV